MAYEYRHIVGIEETNVIGNVYFTNYLLWQGRCRELFLRDECPSVLDHLLSGRLHLVTRECSCAFERELYANDALIVRLRLQRRTHTRLWLDFEYVRMHAGTAEQVARGMQVIGCMVQGKETGTFTPSELPEALVQAVERHPMERSV